MCFYAFFYVNGWEGLGLEFSVGMGVIRGLFILRWSSGWAVGVGRFIFGGVGTRVSFVW